MASIKNPWNTANPDWQDQFMAGKPLPPHLPLLHDSKSRFAAQAQRARDIFGSLRIPDVIGTPRPKEAGGEWFFAIVEALL